MIVAFNDTKYERISKGLNRKRHPVWSENKTYLKNAVETVLLDIDDVNGGSGRINDEGESQKFWRPIMMM